MLSKERLLHTHTLPPRNATDFCTVLYLLILGTKTRQKSGHKVTKFVKLGGKSLYSALKKNFPAHQDIFLAHKKKSFGVQKLAGVLQK